MSGGCVIIHDMPSLLDTLHADAGGDVERKFREQAEGTAAVARVTAQAAPQEQEQQERDEQRNEDDEGDTGHGGTHQPEADGKGQQALQRKAEDCKQGGSAIDDTGLGRRLCAGIG